MSFFDDDNEIGIEDIFSRLTGGGGFRSNSRNESFVEISDSSGRKQFAEVFKELPWKNFLLDRVVTKKAIHFIFDFSSKKNIFVKVKDELIINNYNKKISTGKKVLLIEEKGELITNPFLLENIKTSKFDFTFNNGILEVSFKK